MRETLPPRGSETFTSLSPLQITASVTACWLLLTPVMKAAGVPSESSPAMKLPADSSAIVELSAQSLATGFCSPACQW